MTERNQLREAERLSAEATRRLLARASELEAARDTEMSVAELREIAREAGIGSGSFDQALAELRAAQHAPAVAVAPLPRRWRRIARFWPVVLIVALFLSFFVARVAVPPTP